jgi:hypothetical protein
MEETEYIKASKLLMRKALELGGEGGEILKAVKIIMDERSLFKSKLTELLKDMQIQTEPTGPYSMDNQEHANNVIEHMKSLATKSLIKTICEGDDISGR